MDGVDSCALCIVLIVCSAAALVTSFPEKIVQEGFLVVGEGDDYVVFNDILFVNSSVYIGGCTGQFRNSVWTILKLNTDGSSSSFVSGEKGLIMGLASDGSRIYVAGWLEHDEFPKITGFLAAFTLNLEKLWEKEWVGSPVASSFEDVYVEGDWVYVVGEADYSGSRGFDVVLQKYDKSGSLLWEKTLAIDGQQEAGSLVVSDGKVYVAGTTTSSGSSGSVDGLIAVIDERSGRADTILWGGRGRDFFKSLKLADALYVCGFTDSYGKGDLDGLLLKLDPRGEVAWWTTYGGAWDDSFIDLIIHNGMIHVVGHATINRTMLPVYLQYNFDGILLNSWVLLNLSGFNLSSWTAICSAEGVIHVVGNAGSTENLYLCRGIYARYVTRYLLTVNLPRDNFWAVLDGENRTGRSVSFETPGGERRLQVTAFVVYGGTRLVFDVWSDGVRGNPRTVRVVGDTVLNATYRVEHYVDAVSEFGVVSGVGWYAEGSTATVTVEPSTVSWFLLVNHVFDGWYENGRKVSQSPTFSFLVTRPVQLRAGWRTELNLAVLTLLLALLLLVLLLLALLLLAGRKRDRAPPQNCRYGLKQRRP